jgi:ABC-type lipoprotein export system ATPase subunit
MDTLATTQPQATSRSTLAACRRLTVIHGSREARVVALDRVDLEIVRGEKVALWGPSGSGKTTLLHALGGLVEPSDGLVVWDGEPLSSLDASKRARIRGRGIAYVFQGSNLLPVFTAFENIAFAAYASGERSDVGAHALELLALVGLRDKADSLPSELAGGEAQRVAIARALAQSPELLLCDEPTGHLDTDTTTRVLELIEALHDRGEFAVVVATHDADLAARLGRVVELRDGRIVEDR